VSISRRKAIEHSEKIIASPRSSLAVKLRHGKGGVVLLHKGRALTRCYVTPSGIRAATLMAKVVGARVPPMGASVQVEVSTGVLWRAISISSLDFRKKEAYLLAQRLLEEVETMLTAGAESA